MFSYRLFEQGEEKLLAICDKDVLGKDFSEGEVSIEVNDFYSDKNCEKEEAIDLVKNATIINAVGNEIIDLLVNENIINKSNVIRIGDVMHAQIVAVNP